MNANAQAEAGQDGEAEQFLLLKMTGRGDGFGWDVEWPEFALVSDDAKFKARLVEAQHAADSIHASEIRVFAGSYVTSISNFEMKNDPEFTPEGARPDCAELCIVPGSSERVTWLYGEESCLSEPLADVRTSTITLEIDGALVRIGREAEEWLRADHEDERRPQCVSAALQSAIRWFGGRHAHTVATKAPGP